MYEGSRSRPVFQVQTAALSSPSVCPKFGMSTMTSKNCSSPPVKQHPPIVANANDGSRSPDVPPPPPPLPPPPLSISIPMSYSSSTEGTPTPLSVASPKTFRTPPTAPFRTAPTHRSIKSDSYTYRSSPSPKPALKSFDPLYNNSSNNSGTASPSTQLPPPPPISTTSNNSSISQTLADIAKELSCMIPVQEPPIEEKSDDEDTKRDLHSSTLGQTPKESTGTKKSHKHHKRWNSMDSTKKLMSMSGHHPVRKSRSHECEEDPFHPLRDKKKKLSVVSTSAGRTKIPHEVRQTRSLEMPSNANAGQIVLRSTELDPSLHQIEIPSPDCLLAHARICAVMEEYRYVDQNFDFNVLTGLGRLGLNGTASTLVDKQKPIVTSVIECADDLVVEAFFASGETCHERVEVAVFSSEKRREFIVCWRGTTDNQIKPVRNREIKSLKEEGKAQTTSLHTDHPVPIFPTFKDTYFKDDLEGKVFSVLGTLVEDNPFCDLICTGHSFGAALATISAARYASLFPMMRVSCHAFGSPKVGGKGWRQLVHSLPNLKVIRIENNNDPSMDTPTPPLFQHVGHTIRFPDIKKSSSSNHTNKRPHAYKFDKLRPSIANSTPKIFSKKSKHKKKSNHEIRAYVHAIEGFTHRGMPWVKGFEGETGKGVEVGGGEMRNMV